MKKKIIIKTTIRCCICKKDEGNNTSEIECIENEIKNNNEKIYNINKELKNIGICQIYTKKNLELKKKELKNKNSELDCKLGYEHDQVKEKIKNDFICINKIYETIQKSIIIEYKKHHDLKDYNPSMTNTNETYMCKDCLKKIKKFKNEKIHEKVEIISEDERRKKIEENIKNNSIKNSDKINYEKEDANNGYY